MSSVFETQLTLSRPYLTKKQLQRAQKNTIPDRRAYNQRKLVICKFLSDICIQLKFPRRTLETAVYFYQRYHVTNRFETEMCYNVATSCLFLACKQVETIKKVNEICTVSLKLRNVTKITPETLDTFKKRVFQIELRILESCSFDYRVNNSVHIDEYIVKLGKELKLNYKVCYLAWIIAYDVLKLDIILMIPQHTISLAVLKIAYELSNETDWPKSCYIKYGSDNDSVNEAYFDIINFYINAFTLCDLKDNLPPGTPVVSVDKFMELKKNAGEENGLKEMTEECLESDAYLTKARDYSIRERRYVLSPELIEEEGATGNGKKRKLE